METYIQLTLNSICSGLTLGLVALGFSYIFYVTKVFHLAHAAIYAMSGLLTWKLYLSSNSFFFALLVSLVISLLFILFIEKAIYLPLYKSKVDQNISLISSMGIYVVIVNLLALFFGNENKVYDLDDETLNLGEILITNAQQWQIISSLMAIATFYFILRWRYLNLDFRAISESEINSSILGINIQNRRLWSLFLGTGLICVASWSKSLEVGIEPHSGMNLVLTAAVVSILITKLNVILIVFGAILLSIIQNIVEWNLNAHWRDGMTFFLLLLVLLFKTEGLISYNIRKDHS